MTQRIPTLETARLIVRELTMDDLDAVHRLLNDAFGGETPREVRERWLRWTVLSYEMFAMLEQPHYGERAIALKETGELVGAIGIVPYIDSFAQVPAFKRGPDDPARAEVGLFWAIAPAHQGRGYATEAARVVVYYLFRYLRLGRVIATTAADNHASQAVMRKLGMTVTPAQESAPPGAAVVGVLDNRSAWRTTLYGVIRHPTEPRLFCRQWRRGWGPPQARVRRYVWNASTEAIARALRRPVGGPVWVNRLLHYAEDEERKRIAGVYEVAPDEPPGAGEWVDRGRLATLPLRDEWLRPILDDYLRALESGVVPAARPVWADPAWRAGVRAWVERKVGRLGHTATGLEQVKHWCLSSVLRVKTGGPTFYFKAPVALPLFVDEAVVTGRLAARFPRHVPAPLAIDPERGWMLFPDFGEPFSWHTPLADRQAILRRFARLQREAAPLADALLADGCLDRRLDVLERQIDPLLADADAVAALTPEQTAALREAAPRLKALCRELAAFAIPQTLVHGDLHVGNVARVNGEIVYFDWTDACIAHPFFDLLSLHWESNDAEREAVRAAYLEAWAGVAAAPRLREAMAIADVLLPLHHAVSYQHIRAGLEPAARVEILPPASFLQKALAHWRQYEGVTPVTP